MITEAPRGSGVPQDQGVPPRIQGPQGSRIKGFLRGSKVPKDREQGSPKEQGSPEDQDGMITKAEDQAPQGLNSLTRNDLRLELSRLSSDNGNTIPAMNNSLPFDIVDVFAECRYQGNPLAVFHNAAGLSTDEMQSIALETNFSETTFICGGDLESGFDVRIFTPSYEMPFAGHPTLGTAAVLRRQISLDNKPRPNRVTLNLTVGAVPVDFADELAWLTSPKITIRQQIDRASIAHALSLNESDLDPAHPVELVSSGPDYVMIPMASLDALETARLNLTAFAPLAAQGIPVHLYLFARGGRDPARDMTVRLFFEASGIREDPATGSAACCLGSYLLAHPLLSTNDIDITLAQGASIRRPSVLHLRASSHRIEVGGQVISVASGQWQR